MSILLALILAQAAAVQPVPPVDVIVGKPKKRCELVSEIGSLRKRRVCVTEADGKRSEEERRDAARRILEQNDREQQLVKDNYGEKPL